MQYEIQKICSQRSDRSRFSGHSWFSVYKLAFIFLVVLLVPAGEVFAQHVDGNTVISDQPIRLLPDEKTQAGWEGVTQEKIDIRKLDDVMQGSVVPTANPNAKKRDDFVDSINTVLEVLGAERSLAPETKQFLRKIKADFPSMQRRLQVKNPVFIERGNQKALNLPDARAYDSFRADTMMQIDVKTADNNLPKLLQEGYYALMSGQMESAIVIYKQALEMDGGSKQALFGLAASYQKAGQYDQAKEQYQLLLKKDPRNKEALNNYLVLVTEESPEEALIEFEQLEKHNPEFSPISAQIGLIHMNRGDYQQAFRAFTRAVYIDPDNLIYRYNLAVLLDKMGKYNESVRLYRQIIQEGVRGNPTPVSKEKLQDRINFIIANNLLLPEKGRARGNN